MTASAWGDPLSCGYSWIEPADLADYAGVVRHVARKVGATAVGLETLSAIPESVFAGATAESARAHAERRSHDAQDLRSSLREVAEAIHEHADMLRRYRDALQGLHDLAATQGLEVRDRTIWPPAPTPPPSPTQQQYDAWVSAWKSYRTCFDLKSDIEAERREHSLALARALTTHTDARPEPLVEGTGSGRHGVVDFGQEQAVDRDARREAAEHARRTLEVHEQLASTLDRAARLRDAHRTALDELHRLARAGASEGELTAQAREVRLAAEALRTQRMDATRLQAELAERIS